MISENNCISSKFDDFLKEAHDKGVIAPDYRIKRTKLPRKLKKKYKKEQRIRFDIEYIECRQPQGIEFIIPIENENKKNKNHTR